MLAIFGRSRVALTQSKLSTERGIKQGSFMEEGSGQKERRGSSTNARWIVTSDRNLAASCGGWITIILPGPAAITFTPMVWLCTLEIVSKPRWRLSFVVCLILLTTSGSLYYKVEGMRFCESCNDEGVDLHRTQRRHRGTCRDPSSSAKRPSLLCIRRYGRVEWRTCRQSLYKPSLVSTKCTIDSNIANSLLPPYMKTHSSPFTFSGGSAMFSRVGLKNACAEVQKLRRAYRKLLSFGIILTIVELTRIQR